MKTIEEKIYEGGSTDTSLLVKFAKDLRFYSDNVAFCNKKKKEIREYLNRLKQFHEKLLEQVRKKGIDITQLTKKDRKQIQDYINKNRQKNTGLDICNGVCIIERLPPKHMSSIGEIALTIYYLEYQLGMLGENTRLAEIDLKNAMLKGELLLEMTSKLSNKIKDSAMAIIRDIE